MITIVISTIRYEHFKLNQACIVMIIMVLLLLLVLLSLTIYFLLNLFCRNLRNPLISQNSSIIFCEIRYIQIFVSYLNIISEKSTANPTILNESQITALLDSSSHPVPYKQLRRYADSVTVFCETLFLYKGVLCSTLMHTCSLRFKIRYSYVFVCIHIYALAPSAVAARPKKEA